MTSSHSHVNHLTDKQIDAKMAVLLQKKGVHLKQMDIIEYLRVINEYFSTKSVAGQGLRYLEVAYLSVS